MRKVYADNGATSFPKAPGVSDAMKDFLDNVGCNINRSGYESSYDTALDVLNTRKLLCKMFNAKDAKNVIFTPGVTYSLNMILKGLLKDGDHAIITSMEHNAVMRPFHGLSEKGVAYDAVLCDQDGVLNSKDIIPLINSKTKAVVISHASNVCGTVMPIYEVSEICKNYNISLIVDAAQTAGVLDIDMSYIDALAFTGHKGLLASQGIGGFIVKSELAAVIDPIITGGTGSLSHEMIQPSFLPDKFESGTMSIPAILGLGKALEYINSMGTKVIFEKEMKLTAKFISEISGINGIEIIGKKDLNGRTAVISLNFKGRDNAEIAAVLDNDYGIMTRCGLHCAPIAHRTLHTYPEGTVRFSFGHFNTLDEIEYIIESIKEILNKEKKNGL